MYTTRVIPPADRISGWSSLADSAMADSTIRADIKATPVAQTKKMGESVINERDRGKRRSFAASLVRSRILKVESHFYMYIYA